ncbi:MAG: NAD-dependent epimerase/dehydratase family protein [Gammaproteobacteria bacterium]
MQGKILITGGSGFIGTNLIERFVRHGHRVLNIDFKQPRNPQHTRYWQNTDITKASDLRSSVESFDPDYVVHLAARTDLDGTCLSDYAANTKGVENIARTIRDLGTLKKVVFASSMLVCHGGYHPKDQFDYAPTTIYGQSKIETERIIWDIQPQSDWCIMRPTSIWGPWFGPPYRSFFDLIIQKRYFHIGRQGCTKTYGYVGNTTYQIECLLFSETSNPQEKIFYLGDRPPLDIEKWANQIACELGSRIMRLPYFSIKLAALCGDILKRFGIGFPMNSFRLKNMTTNHIIDLDAIYRIAPDPPFSTLDGIRDTLGWIGENP